MVYARTDEKVCLMPLDGDGVKAISSTGGLSLPRIMKKELPSTLEEITTQQARTIISGISPLPYDRGMPVEFRAVGLTDQGDVLYVGKGAAMTVASDYVEAGGLSRKQYYSRVYLRP